MLENISIANEVAVTDDTPSFMLAGGIYGGKIVVITDESAINALFLTYDANKQEGMIITKEEVSDAFNIRTIYINHSTDRGSVRHIIEPITDVSKKENNMIHYKGKLAL